MERTGYSEHEVETALGLLAEAGAPPTEIKTGADVQFRAAWVLGAEVRALREELEAAKGAVLYHMCLDLKATIARVEELPAKWTSRARNARNSEARVRYDQAAFELEAALRPCASSEPDTAPISAPDGQAEEAVVLENPAKQRGKLL